MSDALRARLTRLLGECLTEREALDRRHQEMAAWRSELAGAPGRPIVALACVDLHDYYTATEALFERVARQLDGDLPSGPGAHREIIEQMAVDLPPLRGALVGRALLPWLHDLRAFRHFFRHSYAVDPDPVRLRALVDDVLVHHAALVGGIDAFLDATRAVRDRL